MINRLCVLILHAVTYIQKSTPLECWHPGSIWVAFDEFDQPANVTMDFTDGPVPQWPKQKYATFQPVTFTVEIYALIAFTMMGHMVVFITNDYL